ncbi:MAG: DUF4367 domain-containing protein [Bacillota bacterium]
MENRRMDKTFERYEESAFQIAIFLSAEKAADGLIKEAEEERAKLPSEYEIKRVKRTLTQNIRKENLLLFGRASRKIGIRIAVAIMIFITVSFTAIMSVKALRNSFAEFLLTFNADYTALELRKRDYSGIYIDDGQAIGISDAYIPSYIPEGFNLKSLVMDEQINTLYYENSEGKYIHFSGFTSDAQSNVDTENADTLETVTIKGRSGLLIKKEGVYTLAWSLDEYYFILTTDLSIDATLKIAESVSFKNK